MIVDLQRFVDEEQAIWTELESFLERLDRDPYGGMSLSEIRRFHHLYQRTSNDLSRVTSFSAEAEIRRYLEALVGKAYGHIHQEKDGEGRLSPFYWLFHVFPVTFRKHVWAFLVAFLITLLGALVGAAAITLDKEAKSIIMPFSHLSGDPAERVAREEKGGADQDRLHGHKATFSAFLMTHNTKVSLSVFALGFTWGIGTVILIFYNGVILGAVALDYIAAGQATFLLGWLLPHGVIEIPAVMVAGQAGLLLASTLVGRRRRASLRARFRQITADLVTLLVGLALMLVWAGIVEAFFSQYHEPVVPYGVKIAFGLAELGALVLFLGFSGRSRQEGHHGKA